jgi:hypothetical protein
MTEPAFDIAAARRLVDEIAADLDALPEGSTRHAELRGEVAQLKAMLAAADAQPTSVEAGMRSVHSRVEKASSELQSDGFRAGLFLQDIGRMLGLD